MDLLHAQVLAEQLMKQHGLIEKGWVFRFDRGLKRFGVCKYGRKVVGLSRHLTLLNERHNVEDVILHEIAHALVGPGKGHGMEWKMMCMKIGARPVRCYSSDRVTTPKLKYHAKCGGCGKEFQKARLHKKFTKYSCKCQTHKPWSERFLLEFKER